MEFVLIYLYLFVWPSRSATTSEKSKKVRGLKKPLEGRYILSKFDEGTGQVLGANSKNLLCTVATL